jgi:hypothetical protein
MSKQNIIIPGSPITVNTEANIYYSTPPKFGVLQDIGLENKQMGDFLPPLLQAQYSKDNNTLEVTAVAIISKEYKIKVLDFHLNYNYSFNEQGEPQLNIYIYFTKHITETEIEYGYDYCTFKITLDKEGIGSSNQHEDPIEVKDTMVPQDDIQTVQAYVVNTDPRTSRGTVTTVQNPG